MLSEWLVMPMGLSQAPGKLMHVMHYVLRHLIGYCVVVYFDDILVFSESLEEHAKHVQEVLQVLRKEKLCCNCCRFFLAVRLLVLIYSGGYGFGGGIFVNLSSGAAVIRPSALFVGDINC